MSIRNDQSDSHSQLSPKVASSMTGETSVKNNMTGPRPENLNNMARGGQRVQVQICLNKRGSYKKKKKIEEKKID